MKNIRIVLVNPSHPGNIGATARAMKNMGLSQLYLVQPVSFPDTRATARAAGADDILTDAVVVQTLTEALVDCQRVYGTSARRRNLAWPLMDVREAAQHIVTSEDTCAVVFGCERAGLSNEDLASCHYHVTIPTTEFSSLNLAAAVQIVSYEMYTAAHAPGRATPDAQRALASADQMAGFYQHLQSALVELDFIDPKQPKMLMQRLKRLFNRADIDETELNILRGILSAIEKR